jgi:hypothetical protein
MAATAAAAAAAATEAAATAAAQARADAESQAPPRTPPPPAPAAQGARRGAPGPAARRPLGWVDPADRVVPRFKVFYSSTFSRAAGLPSARERRRGSGSRGAAGACGCLRHRNPAAMS